jgi:hypothetical protein
MLRETTIMNRYWQVCFGITVAFSIATSSGVVRAQSQAPSVAPATTPPTSSVPRSVPFNGQLVTPKGEARTGSALLTFGLYTDQKDGTPIWTEQQLVALDNDGRYSVILGSTSADGLPADAFAAGTPRWLGVQVEGDQEQPRFMLLSVPYALKAGDADTVAGKPASEFVLSSKLSDSVKSAMKESKNDPSAPLVTPNALVKYLNSGGALTESSTVDNGGKIGIQVSNPIGELDIAGFGSSTSITLRNGGNAADVVKLIGSDGSLRIGSATTANLINLIGTNVGIATTTPGAKLDVNGNARILGNMDVTGNIGAKYQDVAEWVETPEPLEPGTVVIVDPVEPNRVLASSKAYDTRVAGAVSKQPGLILGEQSDTKEMVAQSGRVRIKADAKYGAIRIGDLLVTSPTPGYAMRSRAIKVAGQALHRPGTLLGKALEALPNGKGEILVLLTLQ